MKANTRLSKDRNVIEESIECTSETEGGETTRQLKQDKLHLRWEDCIMRDVRKAKDEDGREKGGDRRQKRTTVKAEQRHQNQSASPL